MSSLDWVPQLAAALEELVPLEDNSRADWNDVVARLGSRHQLVAWRRRPRRSLRLAIVVAVIFLLLTGVATATYLLLRGNGGIALGGGTSLPVVNPNGPGLHAVASCSAPHPNCSISEPAWSPDGTQLAYLSGPYGGPRGTSHFSLYLADPNGGDARQLASCGGCAEQWGSSLGWSPDGKWIAYSRDDGRTGQASLWIASTAGGRPRRLTDCGGWYADIQPRWSPTRSVLAFERITIDRKHTHETLYTIRPDGSGLTRITSGSDPEWSPDGRRIAFDGRNSIEVANADGSDAQVIATGATGGTAPGAASWSPDGQKLVYAKTPGRPANFYWEVWTMNADGSGKKLLYQSGCCVMDWAAPVWSPDGRMIAFSANSAGGTFVMNADGTDLRRLSPETFSGLSWQGTPQH